MGQSEMNIPDNPANVEGAQAPSGAFPQGGPSGSTCGCSGNGGPPPSYVYALGRIQTRFPNLAIEKEFAQVVGRCDVAGMTDAETFHAILSRRDHRYLARKLCWILAIEGIETYLLEPRDPADLDLLIESLRARPHRGDVDVVIGLRGAIAPPGMCNGLQVPVVGFDQVYSFDVDTLVKAIPRPAAIPEDKFGAAAEELFTRIMQLTDNAGATDADRALNYLAVRYPAIYATAVEAHSRNTSLAAVDVRPSRLSGVRRIVDVVFSYVHRSTDVCEKYFVRVDLTEEFPFLVSKMSPFYDR